MANFSVKSCYGLNSSKLFRKGEVLGYFRRAYLHCNKNAGAICCWDVNDDFTNWMKIADLFLYKSASLVGWGWEVHSSLSKCTWKLPQISSYAPRRFDRQPFTRNKQQSFKFDDKVDQNSQFGIISTPSAPKNFHLMKEPTPRYRNRNSNNNSRNMTPPDILLDLSLTWVWKPCF